MPLVTVSEILRLALPPGTRVVAGARGLGNAVTWTRLLRARPASLGRIDHGEIWLLSAAALQLVGEPRSVARMVRDMAQAGVVAFVTPETVAREVVAQADAVGSPVLRVPVATPLADLAEAIVGVLVDRDRSLADEPLAVALRPLTLRGAIEGYLAVLGPTDDFVDFDHQVADRAASVLAIELAKQSAVVEARLRLQGDFLTDLLENPVPPDEQLLDRARRLGYDLGRPHLAFVLRARGDASSDGVAGSRGQQRFIDAARRRLVLADVTTL